MGNDAIKDEETPEAKAAELAESKAAEEVVEAEKRAALEAEGKTPEEIEALMQESDEVEIVRADSQPRTSNEFHGIQKRVNRLNKKVDVATGAASEAEQALALERETNNLLRLQIEQNQQVPTMPNPDDFDEGISDPKFIQQQVIYNESLVKAEVSKQVAEFTQQNQNTATVDAQSQALIRKQTEHYEKVKELKVNNYLDREDKALEILGQDAVNCIIRKIPDAHNMLYYLGTDGDTNRLDVERLAHLARTDAESFVLEIGGLNATLRVKPKSKTTQAPDPDEEIQGSVSTHKKRKGPTFE